MKNNKYQPTMNQWPFDQPRNCAVFTTKHVLKEGRDILEVYHDEDDHGWQFHYGGDIVKEDAMVVCLECIVEYDPTVLEVADIPPGWMAYREKKGTPWHKQKTPDDCPQV